MSESFGGLKDFSVDAQRRMFVEQQERERREAENKKASRQAKRMSAVSASGAQGAPSGVALSGLMSILEGGRGAKKVTVGADDDDSIADDDWSLDSEESFYVGIERADYAQPDNLEMYGEEKEEDFEPKEDRFGISRVSVAIINREGGNGDGGPGRLIDWDADIPIHDEKSSSLYDFMNGSSGIAAKASSTNKDNFVAMPLAGSALEWAEEGKLREDDAAVDQVYQHKAAEGKAFIDKIVNAPSEARGGDASTGSSSMACPPTAPEMDTPPGMTPGSVGGIRGTYPVLSPLALFSPGITAPGSKVAEGEDNGLRQMRERELRKEASADANRKMKDLKKLIAAKKDASGKVDANEMMKMLERLMEE
eukprot:CAMPEP_0172534676 /NCGR_PEP_ID=MMETSP1067-20121228/6951_1 /TAXON_ID=265564 ORGANISM="Thalassiosira punctigera, Strain Tpunct2005C2" /NCGR_SAMPLE_ID=MMETSP1067 /ASSEMBLY_ACC=CAM_ASM_000444 /LENGTH=364 /DNA_ID=CAMNT_0013319491 /DNA_START=158 /DNA_END=1252 /DNA_ORIENTATION=+